VIVICAGVVARQPLPGQVWFWLQYLLGFRRLGHDVYFLEESGEYPYAYDFETMTESDDPARGVANLERFLGPLEIRWAYRVRDECYGLDADEFAEVCAAADLLLTLPTGIWFWREDYDRPRVRLFLDGDPAFTQLRAIRGDWPINETLERCNRFFTYGPGLVRSDSPIPDLGREWLVTRPPVVLDEWPAVPAPAAGPFTTVMHWGLDPSPELDGEPYGQKDVEFERVINLPRRVAQPLEVALNDGPFERLERHGWHVRSRPPTDLEGYRDYIRASRGEFSVAKNGYVRARTGWMSERTICFLATGRPAVVQDTGLSEWVPTGRGLLTFETADDAAERLDAVETAYDEHARAARRLAEAEFESDRVLTQLLADAGV
jgi:hypothetical protein